MPNFLNLNRLYLIRTVKMFKFVIISRYTSGRGTFERGIIDFWKTCRDARCSTHKRIFVCSCLRIHIESSVSVDAVRLMLISHVLSWYPETLFLAPSRMPREYIIFCRIIPTANTHLSTIFFLLLPSSHSPIRTLAYLNLEFSFFICCVVVFFSRVQSEY